MSILRKWALAIAIFIALIVDGICSLYLHQFMTYDNFGVTSVILPISMMLIGLFDDTNEKEIYLAIGAGVVADIYFYSIVGIYTVFLPVSCWICQKVARFLPEIFWARLIVILVGTTAFVAYSCLIFDIIGLVATSIYTLLMELLVNLGWSIIFFILLYWIWGNLVQDYPFLVDLKAYRV
ncbi:rod shape-determining protein MreD [Lactobacillus ultunensis]|uniref:Rod shape-determining protein MreD n=1 Tax=Lactobacillus ultunensis DSM 16047 TaxID=525365 RepID=C2EKG3_9LACO|nr:rod shape-determining protein MreD [Lactobacillus ultunensis]EEJ72928.1 rod shape-determining protein MreD [Lactobacillus ultunensis DSM 16047]KRL81883.1 cell shape determining protein [Lactobacillus ultunensis DSM 16047]QQP27894.1 rod shape-determining protein MreD [Lactobacillus ultunensis]